jgi:DNA invertase Pin-like site-specific DNA recombinase
MKYVAYYRVSTTRQGRSGLGLEAQKHAVAEFLAGSHNRLVAEHIEVESGRKADRPELQAALAACRVHGATLLIAKIDRLSRNAAFLLSLRDAGVEFVAADLPGANRLTVGILAMVAESEAEAISARTKAALAAARRRGVALGTTWRRNFGEKGRSKGRAAARLAAEANATQRAADRAAHVTKLRAAGMVSPSELARGLNGLGVPAPRGGAWSCLQVQRLLSRLDAMGAGAHR